MDWSKQFPTFFNPPTPTSDSSPIPVPRLVNGVLTNKKVEFADVGCGFGGLVVNVAPLFPETLMLG